MRILAIRGENLASLAEPFEIDLTRAPLADAGLFAITGDTGAGKSTILDALSLALYNDYPRAQTGTNESTPDPSGNEIRTSDPRNILRRSAGSGRAEVDFIGQDGVAYRASWAARRARDRANGRLQNVERKLDRLDGSGNIAVGISDVLAAVVEKTGLTYDQFCRTVLLAQGEFDTFLLATEKERADLLEKITGTDIYSRVSVRVHEEKDRREREIDTHKARLAGIEVLSEEARNALTKEQSDKAEALTKAEAARQALAARRQRAIDIKAARANLAFAEQLLAEVEDRWNAAAPDREHLTALDAVKPLRPLLEARTHCRDRLAAAKAAHVAAKESAEATAGVLNQRRNDASKADEVAKSARDAITRFQPEWDRAAALDTDIRTAATELEEAHHKRSEAAETLEKQKAELTSAKARVTSLTRKREEIDARREASAGLAPLHEQRARINDLFDDEIRITTDLTGALRDRSAKESSLAEITERLAKSDVEIGAARSNRAHRQEELDGLRKALAALNLGDVERRERSLHKLDRLMTDIARAITERDAARAAMTSATSMKADAEKAEQQATARIAEYELALNAAQIKRDALAPLAELAEATASQSAAALRTRLVDGEPCPVCGSHEHPFSKDVEHSALVDKILADRAALDEELARLQRAALDERGKEADERARVASAQERIRELTAKRDESLATISRLIPDIADAAKQADIKSVDMSRAASEVLSRDSVATVAELIAHALKAIDAIRAKASELTRERDKLEGEIGTLAKALAKMEEAATADRGRAEKLRLDISALTERCGLLHGQQQRCRAALDPFLQIAGRAADDLDKNSNKVRLRIAALADDYGVVVRELAAIDADLELAKDKLTAIQASADAAEREFARLTEDADKRREKWEALKGQRAPLLDGEPTSDHRKRYEDALAMADAKRQDAFAALKAAEIDQVRAAGILASAGEAVEKAQLELRAATEAYADACTRSGWDEESIAALLAVPSEIRDEIAKRIEQLRIDRQNALTTLETRKNDLAKLAPQEGEATDEAIAALEAECAQIDEELATIRKRATEIELLQARDDEASAKLAAQRREIDALQADLDVWRAVHEAIGSADGAKFKRYAQGITLRHLVALANRQLAALNPRYALRQSAVSSLALDVIDREMGEDTRSPRSLSGGERFLISLALALALSGLEGRQSFVDTLFIDEGFGSLDRDTLDMAIDALETLQGQGRKVGLITHVQAMMDRIAVQVRVEKRGGGRSVVRVSDGTMTSSESAA